MKARILGMVALLVATSLQALGDDATIAKQLSKELQSAKDRGNLQNFRINVKVDDGTVWMKGRVASKAHRDLALDRARRVSGVRLVVNDIEVETVARASAEMTITDRNTRPAVVRAPIAAARNRGGAVRNGRQVDYSTIIGDVVGGGEYGHQVVSEGSIGVVDGGSYGGYSGNPVPVSNSGGGGSYVAGASYDSAQVPNYAWPSYAAHSNYAGVQYPGQYSAMAWPYIGPFYPYPQVPLGWRKVTLEWDDGWWNLDFKHK